MIGYCGGGCCKVQYGAWCGRTASPTFLGSENLDYEATHLEVRRRVRTVCRRELQHDDPCHAGVADQLRAVGARRVSHVECGPLGLRAAGVQQGVRLGMDAGAPEAIGELLVDALSHRSHAPCLAVLRRVSRVTAGRTVVARGDHPVVTYQHGTDLSTAAR